MTDLADLDRYLHNAGVEHFSARELAPVGKQAPNGTALTMPPRELWGWIIPTLRVVGDVRFALGGTPIFVSSGWRDPAYNAAVGGASSSQHTRFNALDIQHSTLPTADVLGELERHPWAQWLGLGSYASWTHVDSRGLFGRLSPARWSE